MQKAKKNWGGTEFQSEQTLYLLSLFWRFQQSCQKNQTTTYKFNIRENYGLMIKSFKIRHPHMFYLSDVMIAAIFSQPFDSTSTGQGLD